VPALLEEWRETKGSWEGRVVRPVLDAEDREWRPREEVGAGGESRSCMRTPGLRSPIRASDAPWSEALKSRQDLACRIDRGNTARGEVRPLPPDDRPGGFCFHTTLLCWRLAVAVGARTARAGSSLEIV